MADGALFPLGYGLTYASPATPWAPLPEVAVDAAADRHSWFAKGVPAASWSLVVAGPGGDRQTRLTAVPAQALGGRVIVTATDHRVQEGARRFAIAGGDAAIRSEEHTSELQSLMRNSYAVFCLKKKNKGINKEREYTHNTDTK